MIYGVVYFDVGNWMGVLSHHDSPESAIKERNKLRGNALKEASYDVIVFDESEKYEPEYAARPTM